MPEKVKQRLRKQAVKKGLKGPTKDRYVYGTLADLEKKKKK